MCGSYAWSPVLHRLVGDGKLAQVMPYHLRLRKNREKYYYLEILYYYGDHLRLEKCYHLIISEILYYYGSSQAKE